MPVARTTGRELPLPPMDLRLMRDSDERFVEVAVSLAKLMVRLGLQPKHRLLDVGCSVGRLPIGLLTGTDYVGEYIGFDVMRKQVTWARENLEPATTSCVFRYVDVRNARYNPEGKVAPGELRFPSPDARFDAACLFSIFTHFYADDIRYYLAELHRVLRPGGFVVASWFLFDDSTLDAAVNSEAYPMTHRLDDVTIYTNAEDPLRAIAFDENFIRGLIKDAGFEIEKIEHGQWAGGAGPEFQDHVVLRKPGSPVVDNRLQTKVRRRLRRWRRQLEARSGS